ncbi:TPA: ABC-F type ribosomal protection protein Msr(E), partial [Klebsiella pneumoniae]|nr:ABC-F type ribosomal protection protein Msr(E) [Klebsiella pneumoniae]
MSLIIKARNIRLDYAGRDVLDIDELEIHSYDRIGLVGDNGAGKSSLLKVLNGEIVLAEATLQRFGDFAHISQLGGIEIETVEDRAMLSRLGVSNVQNDTMSGGEETRAKIAAAFSQQVHGILADEPTSHLDL